MTTTEPVAAVPNLVERWSRRSTQQAQAEVARSLDAWPFGRVFSSPSAESFVGPSGQQVLNFGSNSYLGLTTDRRVIEASKNALDQFGSGAAGSRFLNGTLDLHTQLEDELSAFYGKEACCVFSTGFSANVGTLATLLRPSDVVVSDREVHASLYEGINLSGAKHKRFKHNDASALRRLLDRTEASKTLVVLEGVFSMDGAIAPLAEIFRHADELGTATLVDEAHGFGVLGAQGRGAVEEQGCIDSASLITITFSKALASCGGAVLGDRAVIDHLRLNARSYIFTSSNVPASIAAALASLRILRAEPELVRQVRRNADLMREACEGAGWKPLTGGAGVIAIQMGNQVRTVMAWKRLFDTGMYVNVALPPAVPDGQCLLRLSMTARHSEEDIARAADALRNLTLELK